MRRSISVKLTLSYIFVVAVSICLAAVLFGAASRVYLERLTSANLTEDAAQIAEALKKAINSGAAVPEAGIRQWIRENLVKSLKVLNNEWFVVSKDLHVLYPAKNSEPAAGYTRDIRPFLLNKDYSAKKLAAVRIKTAGTEYIAVVRPLSPLAGIQGARYLVLYSEVPVGQFRAGLFRVLLMALLASGLLAAAFGTYFARSVSRSVLKLKKRTELISARDFDTKVEVPTGDELEELAVSIDKMAAELKSYDTAQKTFLQNASHELKTPLTSIQGYAEGLRDGVFDDRSAALDVIISEALRLRGIVEELIYLSKLETMEDFFRFESNSVKRIIEDSVEKVKSLAVMGNKKITLALEEDAVLPSDRDKLVQAFINLLGNCIRHAASEVGIKTRRSGGGFIVDIFDDGNGFDEQDLKNIFRRFYKGKNGNTGLGLAITKVIVEKHGGRIEAGNRPGGGAQYEMVFGI